MLKLYSDPRCPHSHTLRLVIEEKELPATIVSVVMDEPSPARDEFLRVNPTGELPAVFDADHVLVDPWIVAEYLDERYPHPPLKPASPVERALMRLAFRRIEQEVYPKFLRIPKARRKGEAREEMRTILAAFDALLARTDWLVGEYSLADIRFAPILYRLPVYGVDISGLRHLEAYCERLFSRPAFERSLTEAERMMREDLF